MVSIVLATVPPITPGHTSDRQAQLPLAKESELLLRYCNS